TRTFNTENRHESCLTRRGILPDRLAGLAGRALDIKEIVGDLEGEPEIMRIAAQRHAQLHRRLAEDGARLAGKRDERAGFETLQPCDRADIEIAPMLGDEIDHLAADHAIA